VYPKVVKCMDPRASVYFSTTRLPHGKRESERQTKKKYQKKKSRVLKLAETETHLPHTGPRKERTKQVARLPLRYA
jgi:hypothetical protein